MNVGGNFSNGSWRCLTCGWMCQFVPENLEDPEIPTCGQRASKYCAGRCADMRLLEYVHAQAPTAGRPMIGATAVTAATGTAKTQEEMRRQAAESMLASSNPAQANRDDWKLPTESQLGPLSDAELASLRDQVKKVLDQIDKAIADKSLCIICANAAKSVILYPCKHQCVCTTCCDKIKECPICRQEIADRIKPFS